MKVVRWKGPAGTTPSSEPCGPFHGNVQVYISCQSPVLPSDVAVAHGNINPERPATPEERGRIEFGTHIIDLEIGGKLLPPRSDIIGYGCAGGGSKSNPNQRNVLMRVSGHPDVMNTIRPNIRNKITCKKLAGLYPVVPKGQWKTSSGEWDA